MLHQVGDLFELNVKLRCQKVKVEMAIEKVKGHISQGTDQITAELIKAVGRTICYEIHKFINSIWNKKKLPE